MTKPRITPVVKVDGLYDGSPYIRFEAWCSCGDLVAHREVDVRRTICDPVAFAKNVADADAKTYLAHVAERHGGNAS